MSTVIIKVPGATPIKIAKIFIRDFRAFPNSPETYEFDLGPEGKNLLLFGENGSGKSSLFQALRLLLNEQPPLKPFDDYRHVFTKGNDGAITVTLTAGAVPDFTWNQGVDHPAASGAGHPFFDFARRTTFLDYKALLQTSLKHEAEANVNLFPLLVETLLREVKLPGEWSVFWWWHSIQFFIPTPIPRREADETDEDYRDTVVNWPAPEKQLTDAANGFLDQLNDLLNAPHGIVSRANVLLSKLTNGITLKLKVGKISRFIMSTKPTEEPHQFDGNEIILSCDYCGYPVEHPPLFLNEARMTAIALALYFAGIEASTPYMTMNGAYRILVLDDVLIGLDLSNRIPVLRLLEEEFKDWQVFLFTFDRVWFDLAQEFTEHSKRWTYFKLFEMPTTPGNYSIPQIIPHKSLLEVGDKHWKANDLMAAAVYVRAAFETRVRNVCESHGIEIAYKQDAKNVSVNKLWEGIVKRQQWRQENAKPDFIDPQLMRDVETMRSTILNQLSHSGSPSLGTRDVQFALETVKKLEHYEFKKIN
jgi:energy-coupling factor transporter ATP-binding protein EcfA2